MKSSILVLTVLAALCLSGCGGVNMSTTSTTPTTYTIGGTVTGLTGTLVLQNVATTLTVSSDGAFTFSNQLATGADYSVSIVTQPTGETCTLTGGSGTVGTANVTTVAVSCTSSTNPTYNISAAVTGLTGTLVLQDNGGDNLTFTTNGTLTFATPISAGDTYDVTVLTQPAGQTCTVTNPSGTANANVTVAVSCTSSTNPTYNISATVSGLVGTLVLQDNVGDQLSFTSNTTQQFASSYASGAAYTVSVVTPPANQTCALSSNSSGNISANVTVAVTCTTVGATTYTLSAAVTGLSGTLALQDSQGDSLTFTSNSTQTFLNPYTSGATYSVSISTQPTGQTCTLGSNAAGTITANTTVAVTCTTNLTLSVAVTGLPASESLVVGDGIGANLTFTSNTTQAFANTYVSGASYAVTVVTQPTGATCTLGSNASGTITANTTVTATCVATPTYTLSVTTTGLPTSESLVVGDGIGANLTFTSNNTQAFANTYVSGASYAVTVVTQPTGATCTLGSNASGTITANTTVTATCVATPTFTLSVTTTGLPTGESLVVGDNIAANLTFTSNTTQSFTNTYDSGASYTVTLVTQPTGATCTLGSNASGTITANTTVTATCVATALTLSATTTGLSSGSLVLQDNTGAQLTFTGNTTQQFSNTYTSGATYSVTIATQPSGETCALGSNASGTITADTTVTATCSSTSGSGDWLWINGSDNTNTAGNYPTSKPGTGDPGARYGASTWIDLSGNLWLFGGYSYDKSGAFANYINDLWKFNGTTWTWVSGSNAVDQSGVYGTGGTSIPGARAFATSWTDSSGNLWLFGGYGLDSTGENTGPLNDLWEFTGGEWDWINGSDTVDQLGVYNGLGNAGTPGARYEASGATDSHGNFWLFGGAVAIDASGNQESFNDLWEFTNNQWIWVSGSSTGQQQGTYSGSGAVPGAREGQSSWMDSSNNLWVYAGNGFDSTGAVGYLNDLWEFSNGSWSFVSGAKVVDQAGSYPSQTGETGGPPGSREFSSAWVDSSGNFWIFGGETVAEREFNDLWKFNSGTWTWVSGSDTTDQIGVYTGAAGSLVPGGREESASWIDSLGNLWVFGGQGFAIANANDPSFGALNDLWEFQPQGTPKAPASHRSVTRKPKTTSPSVPHN